MILMFDEADFSKPMYGSGCAAVVASAIRQLGNTLQVVGATSGKHVLGVWTKVELFGHTVNFLPVMTVDELKTTNLRSERALFLVRLFKYRKAIIDKGVIGAFTQSYAALWWLAIMGQFKICFYFPGLANPLSIGRKGWLGKLIAPIYTLLQLKALKKVELAVAAASANEISKYNDFLKRNKLDLKVNSFPTAVNEKEFSPASMSKSRRFYDLSDVEYVVTYVGRIAEVKGIPLLFKAIQFIKLTRPEVKLLLVGDGEILNDLKAQVCEMGLGEQVEFLGNRPPHEVSIAINCANVCAVSSFTEGFSCAMLEQLSCGKPIVSTNVSGASDLILEGVNGFIVNDRNHEVFAQSLIDADTLKDAKIVSRKVVLEKYTESAQWKDLSNMWPELRNYYNH